MLSEAADDDDYEEREERRRGWLIYFDGLHGPHVKPLPIETINSRLSGTVSLPSDRS